MNQTENENAVQMKLYLAHVGFYDPEIGIYELHSNLLIAAPDVAGAKKKIINNPLFVKKQMHIDGLQEISCVDDYEVKLEKQENNGQENKTYSYTEIKRLS